MSKPQQFSDWPISIQPGFGPYRAAVERVVDGDTVYVFADLGLNAYAYRSVRFKDVDAPEIFSGPEYVRQWGRNTREELDWIFQQHGTKTLMHTTRDKMSHGRYEAILVLPDNSTVNMRINEWMKAQEWWPRYLEYKAAA